MQGTETVKRRLNHFCSWDLMKNVICRTTDPCAVACNGLEGGRLRCDYFKGIFLGYEIKCYQGILSPTLAKYVKKEMLH